MLFLFPFQHTENGKHSNTSTPQACSHTDIFIQKFKRSSSEAGVGAFQHGVTKGRGSMRATAAGLLRRTSLTDTALHVLALGGPKCAYWEMNCTMLSLCKRHAGLPQQPETQLAVRASGRPLGRSRNDPCTNRSGQKEKSTRPSVAASRSTSKSLAKPDTGKLDSFSCFVWKRNPSADRVQPLKQRSLSPHAWQTPPSEQALLSPPLSQQKDARGTLSLSPLHPLPLLVSLHITSSSHTHPVLSGPNLF